MTDITGLANTEAGKKAYGVLDWVFGDPGNRAGEGLNKINEIYRGAADPAAQREISDAATMCSRLR